MESHSRSILKAASWRGLLDTVIKMGAYYTHERGWNNLNFGKVQEAEYQI
ncbi:MAG: DUF2061 domain-containing protein [Planctomycetota bacterium]